MDTTIKKPGLPAAAREGPGSLLVCEDNDAIRVTLQRTLHAKGYEVLVAAHPNEALLVAGDQPALDMLITDMSLPVMNGRELAARMKQRHPGLSVLYISGYTSEAFNEECDDEKDPAFLQKPFTPTELLDKVRQILDRSPDPRLPGAGAGTEMRVATATGGLQLRSELEALWRRFAGAEIGSRLAHELKQPLTAITLHCDAALTTAAAHPDADPGLREDIREATVQAFRAARIVNDLQRVLLDYQTTRIVGHLNPVIAQARRLIEPEAVENNVAIDLHLQKDLPATAFDEMQILLAVTGLMRVGLSLVRRDASMPSRIKAVTSLQGENIEIRVESRRPAADPEDLHCGPRAVAAFDDTGLELAVCRRIVAAHGGILRDVTAGTRSACYGFTLPVVTEPARQSMHEAEPSGSGN